MATIEQIMSTGLRQFEAVELLEWFGRCRDMGAGRPHLWSSFGRRYIHLNLAGKDVDAPPAKGWAAPFANRILDNGQRDDQTITLRQLFTESMGQARVD